MEKRGISIRKILIDCVRFWFLLVLFALIGAFLGYRSAVKFNDNIDQLKKADQEKRLAEEKEAEELAKDIVEDVKYTKAKCEKGLSKEEKQDVMDTYSIYLSRKSRREYMESSPYLQIDPYDFTNVYLQYRVKRDTEAADKDNFNSYVHGLKLYINHHFAEDLVEKYNLEVSAGGLSDLFFFSDGGKDTYDDFILLAVTKVDITENIIDQISKDFIAYGNELAKTYPGFSLELVDKYESTYFNTSLNTTLESYRSRLSSDQSKISSAVKKFSGMQKAYYNMLVKGTEEETIQEVVQEGVTTKKKNAVEKEYASKRSLMLMLLLGGVAGGLIAIVMILLGNLISKKLIFPGDFPGCFGVRCCGVLTEKKKNGISGFLQRMEYKDAEDGEDPKLVYIQVREMLKKAECTEVNLLSSETVEETVSVKKLTELAKKDGITIRILSHFPEGTDAAEQVIRQRNVILVERFHRSRLSSIDKIIGFCKDNDVTIHGAICLDG